MIACLIDYFTSSKDYITSKEGVRSGDLYMSFKSIFQDVRSAVDWVHFHGNLKKETVKYPDKFVHKDIKLAIFLNRIRENGAKTMIITNSDYEYTNKIMAYLLDFPEYAGKDWTEFFDFVVVDAKKPLFFKDGTILRKVDRETGALSLGHHVGPLKQGCVYSGGSSDVISDMIGAKGKDVLYVGDHIFGDILRSKKEKCWRTFLVVPELNQELHVWTEQRSLFSRIEGLEYQLGEKYKYLDSSTKEKPDIGSIQRSMMETVHQLDLSYGILGSLFRSGSRLTFFSAQIQRYADIYAASLLNLLHYPFSYMFRAPSMLLPHESTVKHENTLLLDESQTLLVTRQRSNPGEKVLKKMVSVPHLRAETPLRVTHHHDDDDFEDTSSTSSEKSCP